MDEKADLVGPSMLTGIDAMLNYSQVLLAIILAEEQDSV